MSFYLICYNVLMAIAEMFIWWYTRGWRVFIERSRVWFSSVTDFFSMDSLIRTLFKPYRQISANEKSSSGSFDLKFQMFLDRLVSRLIGFASRLILLLLGVVIMIFGGILCILLIILWPLIPLFPIAGIILSITGAIL